jgi:hypothetical protein
VITPSGERLTTRPPDWPSASARPHLAVATTAAPAPRVPFRTASDLFAGLIDDADLCGPPAAPDARRRVPLAVIYADRRRGR